MDWIIEAIAEWFIYPSVNDTVFGSDNGLLLVEYQGII